MSGPRARHGETAQKLAHPVSTEGGSVSIAHIGAVSPSETTERTPPYDMLAEQSTIGGMLISKDAVADVIEEVQADDFYVPKHEIIYKAILDLYSRGEPTDVISVSDELTRGGQASRAGGAEYLHSLTSVVPTAANAGYYAGIVKQKAILRRLVEVGTRIAQMGYASEGDVDDLLNTAQAEVYAVSSAKNTQDYLPLSVAAEAAVKEIEVAQSHGGKFTGVPTGITELDKLTNGLHPGQLIIVAARPGLGKSTLALDFARAATIRSQKPAILFSLEMGKTEIAMRLLSAEAQIPLDRMHKGEISQEQWRTIASTQAKVNDAPLFIDDSPNMTLPEIRAKCRRLRQQMGLELIIIDYLQLMTSGKKVESRQQEVSEFSRSLKLLAKELEVPVVALSQLNRNPDQRQDKLPAISDLRESGSLEQDADIVMLLHRPPGSFDANDPRAGEADIIVAKNRNGPQKTIPVAFQGMYSRFANLITAPQAYTPPPPPGAHP
ncbi:MAG TPA: replicative DNA helicase [Pseudoclavibacter sp.]|nr:replicative DNA helicase [Pseudoclavibacter sp.]